MNWKPLLTVAALLVGLCVCFVVRGGPGDEKKFPPIVNTQNPNQHPPSPQEAASKITVPDGFRVTLFAGDPDVRQPIAIHVDDRGRLWVAESYSYAGASHGPTRWDKNHKDRIVIFEDTDNDGKFDKRKVFWDQAQNLSGITTGFGGVWLLCSPKMLFVPDKNGDDVPDGGPQVLLDGWALAGVGHNIVNGLKWGPDGWLYGRHGIQNTSLVGPPGTPSDKRVKLNCSIWRYHPTKKQFEVVTHGTTNPWGFDYNDHGQMFFTNNVIGHLWHVIPGAHYKRMYGEDVTPHVYGLIDQHADHYHWDHSKSWTASRTAKGKHDELGGGHSHCGGMIYLGDNWPEQYRNTIFMCNTHGRRVNNDKLIRQGSGYVGVHQKDFLFANNPWFRGISLVTGPDGGVYLSDWVDLGECHDHDGVHRTSGRVYKITYGTPKAPKIQDVAKLSNEQLVSLQLHKNDWYVRASRRVLQERAINDSSIHDTHLALRKIFYSNPDVTRKLRAMWGLYVTGGTKAAWLREQLNHKNEHIRTWAIRLLVDDNKVSREVNKDFVRLAKSDESKLVRLFLASALQKYPASRRGELATALLNHGEDADDHNLPLMLWYGIEPLVATVPSEGVRLAKTAKIPVVRRFIARRLTENLASKPAPVSELVKLARNNTSSAFQKDLLHGMSDALEGWLKATPPNGWSELQAELSKSSDTTVKKLVRNLSVVFGDGRAFEELLRIAQDGSAKGPARREALRVVIQSGKKDLVPILQTLVNDRATVEVALQGLAKYNDPSTPQRIFRRFRSFYPWQRSIAIDTLVSRPEYAKALLQQVEKGRIDRSEISAYQARQIHSFENKDLTSLLSEVWGEVRTTPREKRQLIARYKKLLTTKYLTNARLSEGRVLFNRDCASCHKLYEFGGDIGPNLTGGNRNNIDYLLENIIAPSSVVPADFKMSVILMKDGRFFTGVVGEQTPKTITVQQQKEKVKLDRSQIQGVRKTPNSLMPDNLLTTYSEEQIRDLIGYLMYPEQVALPKR
ncbi:MAG: PVC-type heme-binding CxxCH protein [Gemmataceae bacterium]